MAKGAEIGSEVGFYRGCYLVWAHMMATDGLKERIPYVPRLLALL